MQRNLNTINGIDATIADHCLNKNNTTKLNYL